MTGARPLVVVVSGSSGAGKSSLVAALAESLGPSAVTLHFDDFTDVHDLPGGDVTAWLSRGGDPREWRTPLMTRALDELLRQDETDVSACPAVVVVEEPFGRARPPFDARADLSLHLRVPAQVGLARRLLRDLVPSTGGLDHEAVTRLRHHLTRYVAEGDALYEAAEAVALPGADLVLDAREERIEITRQAVDAVRTALAGR